MIPNKPGLGTAVLESDVQNANRKLIIVGISGVEYKTALKCAIHHTYIGWNSTLLCKQGIVKVWKGITK